MVQKRLIGALAALVFAGLPAAAQRVDPASSPFRWKGLNTYFDYGGVTLPQTVTGGAKGVGTINAQGLFVNGVAVGSGTFSGPSTSTVGHVPLFANTVGTSVSDGGAYILSAIPGSLTVSQLPAIGGDVTCTAGSGVCSVTKYRGGNLAAVALSGSGSDIITGTIGTARLPTFASYAGTFLTTQGGLIYGGASGPTVLTPGSSGTFLMSNGAGANLSWGVPSGGGGGGTGVQSVNGCTGPNCNLTADSVGATSPSEAYAWSQPQVFSGAIQTPNVAFNANGLSIYDASATAGTNSLGFKVGPSSGSASVTIGPDGSITSTGSGGFPNGVLAPTVSLGASNFANEALLSNTDSSAGQGSAAIRVGQSGSYQQFAFLPSGQLTVPNGVTAASDIASSAGGLTAGNGTIKSNGTTFSQVQMANSSFGADGKMWRLVNDATGSFGLQAVNDAFTASNYAWYCSRSGYAIAACQMNAPFSLSGSFALTGNISLNNNKSIYWKDTFGTTPYMTTQTDNNFIFWGTDSNGSVYPVWDQYQHTTNSPFKLEVPVKMNKTLEVAQTLTADGGVKMPSPGASLQFTDTSGNVPYQVIQTDNNMVFYGTDASGNPYPVWNQFQHTTAAPFNFNVLLKANSGIFFQATGGLATTVSQRMISMSSIELNPDYCNPANLDGGQNNTACMQSAEQASAAAGGLKIHVVGKYAIDQVSIADGHSGVNFWGDSSENGGSSYINLLSGNEDAFTVGNTVGSGFHYLHINGVARGGGFVFNVIGGQRFDLDHVYMDSPYQCARYYQINHDVWQTVTCQNARGNGAGIEWDATNAVRSDLLILTDSVIAGSATNSNGVITPTNNLTCLHIYGFANSPVLNGFRCLFLNYGIIAEPNSSDGSVPFGMIATDYECDFVNNECARIMGGDEWQFSNSYMNGGNNTTDLVTLGSGATGLQISNSKLISANYSLIHNFGTGVTLTGNRYGVWGRSSNGAAAIHNDGGHGVSVSGGLVGAGTGAGTGGPFFTEDNGGNGDTVSGIVTHGVTTLVNTGSVATAANAAY